MPSPEFGSRVAIIPSSSDPLLTPLLGTWRWASSAITYSFPEWGAYFSNSTIDGYGSRSGGGEPWSADFKPLESSDRTYFASALNKWSAVAAISFTAVTESLSNVGDIRAAYSHTLENDDATAWAHFPASGPVAGDVWFNRREEIATELWTPGSDSYHTVLHEIGHALGLRHPFGSAAFPVSFDSNVHTVMSYSAIPGDTYSWFDFYPTTPMVLDIAAIQHVYGANRSHRTGNDTYAFNDTTTYFETIWDAGGTDTLRYEGSAASTIDLNAGRGSDIGQDVHAMSLWASPSPVQNIWIARGVDIENAVGGFGSDVITGNALANTLTGRAGDDIMDGGAGIDTAVFAGLFSQYRIERGALHVTVTGSDGTDRLTNVERLLIGGTRVALDIDGNAGKAYRLYQAAFDRTPDQPGLGYQMASLDAGITLSNVAQNFISSPEFTRTYGSLDDTQFVTQLYRNVLDRGPDAGGLAFHVGHLGRGMARADVLVGFSESPENQVAVIGDIANGMVYA